jgi:hypothetical protein
MRKNVFLGLLVCLNLALFSALVLRVAQPADAFAQVGGLADNYLVVTGEVTTDNDALYVLECTPPAVNAAVWPAWCPWTAGSNRRGHSRPGMPISAIQRGMSDEDDRSELFECAGYNQHAD